VNINLTMIGQAIAFFIFVVFCMKYVWPPIMAALQERQKKIADGLAASDRAARDLELAQEKSAQELREAKQQAAGLIAAQIVEASKEDARKEGQKLIEQAKAEIEQERNQARDALRAEISAIAVAGAEKILETSVDASKHNEMLEKLAAEL